MCKKQLKEMEELFEAISEAKEAGDLVWDVYRYLTGNQYPPHCMDLCKRAIRRKSTKFVIRDGEMFF